MKDWIVARTTPTTSLYMMKTSGCSDLPKMGLSGYTIWTPGSYPSGRLSSNGCATRLFTGQLYRVKRDTLPGKPEKPTPGGAPGRETKTGPPSALSSFCTQPLSHDKLNAGRRFRSDLGGGLFLWVRPEPCYTFSEQAAGIPVTVGSTPVGCTWMPCRASAARTCASTSEGVAIWGKLQPAKSPFSNLLAAS